MTEGYIFIALGMLAGWYLTTNWPRIRASIPFPTSQTKTSNTGESVSTLAVKLHQLDAIYGPFAQAAAHTNELATNAEFQTATKLLTDPAVPLNTVLDYAFGVNWRLSCAALAALKERADGREAAGRVATRFDQLSVWQIAFALPFLAACGDAVSPSAPLIGFKDWWADDPRLHHLFAEHFAGFGADTKIELEPELRAMPTNVQDRLKTFLGRVRDPIAERLRSALGGSTIRGTGSKFLDDIGRFWTRDADAGAILEPECWREGLAAAGRNFERTPIRSVLISGDALAGKTSFLRLLAERLAANGWRVFEAGGADLQAGQVYIGELENRIRKTLEELAIGRKILWYVPDLLQLAQSGTHSGQSASILDQILPAMSAGQLVILAEGSPKTAARLLQLRPSLRRCLDIVRLDPMPDADVLGLAERVAARLSKDRGLTTAPNLARTAVEAARHFLGANSLPGSALALIRMMVLRTQKTRGATLSGTDVIEALAQVTGLPMAILDGSESLDLAVIRDFFASRVIGQSEAVASVVERIAMLKSGLHDPGRPIGVFLFAGPTGTGKTELAKAVAEYLFGSVERMIRLDMSEYQTSEAVAKILGGANLPRDADTLTSRIRKQPFSLVLLDEFEKASPYIWDLFLQVFDDGRLTDSAGETVDFRHCLIILTTNLGATSHQSAGLGFAPSRSAYTNEQVLRAIGQTFRPEFQNRLDKIIVFKPLTRELMRGILKKELARIFERRGLKDRAWAIEWEASALEFLLEKGFSPDMGARPLKRAIDQYLVTPLAETIVERRFPQGDQFVFVRRDGNALKAEFVDPDGGSEAEPPIPDASAREASAIEPDLAAMIRAPDDSPTEASILIAAQKSVAERLASPKWSEMKQGLADEMNGIGFWSRPERFAILGRFELMDRLEIAAETAQSMSGRIARRRDGAARNARELVSRLALQIYLLRAGLRDLDEKAPEDAAILIEPAFDGGGDTRQATEAWRRDILEMYRNWARKRNMKVEEATGVAGPMLIVVGFGAYRTLARETGVHILEGHESGAAPNRIAVRVVLAVPPQATAVKGRRARDLTETLGKAARTSGVVRRYRRLPSPLVRNADGSWRSGKVDDVLTGDFDLLAHEEA